MWDYASQIQGQINLGNISLTRSFPTNLLRTINIVASACQLTMDQIFSSPNFLPSVEGIEGDNPGYIAM